jgi:hypothetical protein
MTRSGTAATALALTLVIALAAALAGCGRKNFSIVEKRVIASINATGKPGPTKTTFQTTDREAFLYFRYVAAPPGCKVRCEVVYTSPNGERSDSSVEQTLKPGAGSAHVALKPAHSDTLPPGNYQLDLIGPQGSLLGATKLTFTVTGAEQS